jgi:integrase
MHLLSTKSTRGFSESTRKTTYMFRYTATPTLRGDYINDDGKCLISMIFRLNGKKTVQSLNIYCRREHWDKKLKRVRIISDIAQQYELNEEIEKHLSRAHKIYTDSRRREIPLDVKTFLKRYHNEDRYKCFTAYMEDQIAERIRNKEICKETARIDRRALLRLRMFAGEVSFADLSVDFFRQFEGYLINEFDYEINTVVLTEKKISVYISRAIPDVIDMHNPIKDIKKRMIDVEQVYLEPSELDQWMALTQDPHIDGTLREVLLASIFSAFNGGFRISDLKELGRNSLNDDVISFLPYKTRTRRKTLVHLKLNDVGRKILRDRRNREYFFDLPSDQKVNEYLKILASHTKIKKRITTHVFRRTFATLYVNQGGPVNNLARIMGITIPIAQKYVHVMSETVRNSTAILDPLSKSFDFEARSDQNPLEVQLGQ